MSKYSQEIDYMYNEDEEDDLCISIEGFKVSEQYSSFNKETLRSPMLKEKQISVDPISLKQSMRYEEGPPPLSLPSNIIDVTASFTNVSPQHYPPPLPPNSKHNKLVSSSLPSSTTTSPRSQTKNVKKGRRNQQAAEAAASLGLSRFATESLLFRSKSCGEGRASSPSDEFDLFSRKLSSTPPSPKHENIEEDQDGFYPEYKPNDDDVHVSGKNNKASYRGHNINPRSYKDEIDIFKCGKCLFLPAFGKGKPVRARKEEEEEGDQAVVVVERNVISRSVSLEKFECESWTSSAIMNEVDDDRDSMRHLYFDLPLELIRNCGNDANSPVKTAFLFDSDRSGAVNKSSSSSSRHVRFSSTGSSGSCITPRLRKARDDFNAFLQAQNA
ncbi:uncharacterized protein LOC122651244 [Telopea speciosissima]|uniref:uncharacterized protein LOC122651244 n=1 Tax=Telopea speciosissima TaxID=54955 RepID=UPI001CC81C2B|nr:uncharacterized protein LOC122651244 [Telopea speciosissima]